MPIIQPKIIVPENVYKDYLNGNIEIKGLAKNINNGKIVKHLDTIDSKDSNTNKAIAISVGVATLLVVAAGVTVHFFSKAKQKKVQAFKECLNAYIIAASEQTLSTNIIDNLVDAMDNLKYFTRKKVAVEFSTEELSALVECLCNHTQAIAQANNIKCVRKYTEEEKTDVLLKLRKNLIIQREMIHDVA